MYSKLLFTFSLPSTDTPQISTELVVRAIMPVKQELIAAGVCFVLYVCQAGFLN